MRVPCGTPSFLGLIENGPGWAVSPAYGGWGGRHVLYRAYGETSRIWSNNQGSRDPEGNQLVPRWWVYPEAGTILNRATHRLPEGVALSSEQGLTTSLVAPRIRKTETLHVISEVHDTGTPKLWAYRRAVVKIEPGPVSQPH